MYTIKLYIVINVVTIKMHCDNNNSFTNKVYTQRFIIQRKTGILVRIATRIWDIAVFCFHIAVYDKPTK